MLGELELAIMVASIGLTLAVLRLLCLALDGPVLTPICFGGQVDSIPNVIRPPAHGPTIIQRVSPPFYGFEFLPAIYCHVGKPI